MTTQNEASIELFKANVQLGLRTLKLVKECNQRWLGTMAQGMDASIAESQQEIDKLALGEDWASLASVPSETLLHLWQQRGNDAQTLSQAALGHQARLMSGLHDALRLWQRDTAKAMEHWGQGQTGGSFSPDLSQWLSPFAQGADRDK